MSQKRQERHFIPTDNPGALFNSDSCAGKEAEGLWESDILCMEHRHKAREFKKLYSPIKDEKE